MGRSPKREVERRRHNYPRKILKPRRIGVEWPFLPADAAMLLRRFPNSEIVDSLLVLELARIGPERRLPIHPTLTWTGSRTSRSSSRRPRAGSGGPRSRQGT